MYDMTKGRSNPVSTDSGKDVRGRLRDDANEGYELLKTALKEGLDADKPVTRKCEHCGRANTFLVPDHQARMKAVDLWISQGFGKPPAESQDEELNLDVDVANASLEERDELKKRILRKYPDLAAKYALGLPAPQQPQATMRIPRKRGRS
jgi:hypothetical protein